MVFQKGHKTYKGSEKGWFKKGSNSRVKKGEHFSPKTEFKKGNIPWNKDKKGVMPPPWNIDKNHPKYKEHIELIRKIGKKNKDKKLPEENKINLRNLYLNKTYEERYGEEKAKETKKKISEKLTGRECTEETKEKMRRKSYWKGKHLLEEAKQKMRLSAFEYAKKVANIICPRVGHNEKQILNKLEQELNHKIIRQYEVEGYYIDGYILELNIAIEVDEKLKNSEKDIERQKIIENKLGCKFIRIKDYN